LPWLAKSPPLALSLVPSGSACVRLRPPTAPTADLWTETVSVPGPSRFSFVVGQAGRSAFDDAQPAHSRRPNSLSKLRQPESAPAKFTLSRDAMLKTAHRRQSDGLGAGMLRHSL